jgi:tRNA pseudouridine13 synthase
MKIKIKVRPEDFVVEEIAALPLTGKGPHGAYLLRKNGWNTVELLRRLSRQLRIPFTRFSYGGKKDRYALTCQHIGIEAPRQPEIKEKDYSLQFAGFMDRPMGPDLIQANKFEIVVRGLKQEQAQKALASVPQIQEEGYFNYFDDQRFGSLDAGQGFFAEKLLKGHFSGALKIHLTAIRPEEKSREKQRKKFFSQHWKDWKSCLGKAETVFERQAFAFLAKGAGSPVAVLRMLAKEDMAVYFSAYQSYIWNEVLKKILRSLAVPVFRSCPGVAGEYLFYDNLEKEKYLYLRSLRLPTCAAKAGMPDALSSVAYAAVLEENGIKPAMFNKIKLRQTFFKSFAREALVFPGGLACAVSDDEIYGGKKKVTLIFTLPAGSFGTMLVKRLFCDIINA